MSKIDTAEEKLGDLFCRVLEAPKWNGKPFIYDRINGWNNTFLLVTLFFLLPLWMILSAGFENGLLLWIAFLAIGGIVLGVYYTVVVSIAIVFATAETVWDRFRYRKPRF